MLVIIVSSSSALSIRQENVPNIRMDIAKAYVWAALVWRANQTYIRERLATLCTRKSQTTMVNAIEPERIEKKNAFSAVKMDFKRNDRQKN